MRIRRNITRAAWRLAKCYWTSEEKWSAWALLIGVIGLNLGNVYISVRINEWNRSFYNALQAFDSGELFRQLGIFRHSGRFSRFRCPSMDFTSARCFRSAGAAG